MAWARWPGGLNPVLLDLFLYGLNKVMQPPRVVVSPVGSGQVLEDDVARRLPFERHGRDQVVDERPCLNKCLRNVHTFHNLPCHDAVASGLDVMKERVAAPA